MTTTSRIQGMVACIATLLLVMAGSAYAGTENVGNLSSTGAGECDATAIQDQTIEMGGSLKFKADWTFDENSGGLEDRWNFDMEVHWESWPTVTDPITQETTGKSPGDKQVNHEETDDNGIDQEGIDGEIKTSYWYPSKFMYDGEYVAEVTIAVLLETRPWGGTTWSQSCGDSDPVTITIDYTNESGGGEIPVT